MEAASVVPILLLKDFAMVIKYRCAPPRKVSLIQKQKTSALLMGIKQICGMVSYHPMKPVSQSLATGTCPPFLGANLYESNTIRLTMPLPIRGLVRGCWFAHIRTMILNSDQGGSSNGMASSGLSWDLDFWVEREPGSTPHINVCCFSVLENKLVGLHWINNVWWLIAMAMLNDVVTL